jgi:DNA polymerase-1
MKTAFIDADMLIYRAAFAAENLDPLTESYPDAKEIYDDSLKSILNEVGTDQYYSALSHETNFRLEIWPHYKANRKDKRKPDGLAELKEWVFTERNGIMGEGLEADDLIGIYATFDPDNFVACSGDKDFQTLPITWFNLLKGEWFTQTRQEATRNHLLQTLTGDSTDGYSGIPRVGPVKAAKILDEGGDRWSTVAAAYRRAGLTDQDAYVNASMAYILQSHNYDSETGALLYWTPRHVGKSPNDILELVSKRN